MKSWLNILLFVLLLLLLGSCKDVRIELHGIPSNTPAGSLIYVSGNFNHWNPGDPNYLMKFDESCNCYYTEMPYGFGKLSYKFTRGDWTTVEADSCGGDIINRGLVYSNEEKCINYIGSWKDLSPVYCGRLTLVLDNIPENTPSGSEIFLSGNVNYWVLKENNFRFNKGTDGRYYLTLPRKEDKLIFKIHRGTWESVEADANSWNEESRSIKFGEEDTLHISLRNWSDLPIKNGIAKTFIIKKLPPGTPPNSAIYLSGSFNNWKANEARYRFEPKPNGTYVLRYNFPKSKIEYYKITMGSMSSREMKENGTEINNRLCNINGRDTQEIEVEAWASQFAKKSTKINVIVQGPKKPTEGLLAKQPPLVNAPKVLPDNARKIYFIIDKFPEMPAGDDGIYLTGDFNNWETKVPYYAFRNLPNGKKFFILRLKDDQEHEYKITRGDWGKEEADRYRNKRNNRSIRSGSESDTIRITIENWVDYKSSRKLVVVIQSLPLNTPPQSIFYLTGNFNAWNANDNQYRFKNVQGKHTLVIPNFNEDYSEYKVTRGSWSREFANRNGHVLPNQSFKLSYPNDTMYIKITGWVDTPPDR